MRGTLVVKRILPVLAVCAALWCMTCPLSAAVDDSSSPAATPGGTRPWTYWWWPGSAVDEANITRNLERYAAAGLGGVHIIPIYGAMGAEDRYIPYLSPRWMRMLAHTVSEAKRLGMGVDMTSGTGWPFGGPQIGPETAARKVQIEKMACEGGTTFRHDYGKGSVLAIRAVSESGGTVDLAGKLPPSGELVWDAPDGRWTVYALVEEGTGQKVKRAAPGGEGLVMDYFSPDALKSYLSRFDRAFETADPPVKVRAFYNDSYEVYGADWTENLPREFRARRGYDLLAHLSELAGDGPADRVSRVRHDYNETVSDLLLEAFARPWAAWAHTRGSVTRSQSHGSPGNLLDLYAAADIPETEAFGPSGFPIPGLGNEGTDIPEGFGKPDMLVGKFASSAAHVAGKPLVSSESCTWLGEHFKVALSQVKPEIDALFLAGVNHIFYHGIAYSPDDAPWPGWLFYASTDFTPANTHWRDFPALNAYVARCQSFLRRGRPANDVLLYWPVHDRWREKADEDMLHHFQVHNANEWLYGTPFHTAACLMRDRGFTYDYISDRQIGALTVSGRGIETAGETCRAILVPGCRFMPAATLEKLEKLARGGATIIFFGPPPEDVPGYGNLERERARFSRAAKSLFNQQTVGNGVAVSTVGKGRAMTGDNLQALLAAAGLRREPVADSGISFIRRIDGREHIYFLANLGARAFDGWTALGVPAVSASLVDPMSDAAGRASFRKIGDGAAEVYLQLAPGESVILRTFESVQPAGPEWIFRAPSGDPVELPGPWSITFVEGGPRLPAKIDTQRLASWTEHGGDDARSFSGTARYETTFRLPDTGEDDWMLDLGTVRESARVSLNGQSAGIAWCHPFRLPVGRLLRPGENTLVIEVTNLAANRIADLDRRGVQWKRFHDINIVNIRYQPFDASKWEPTPSGLLGPVRLIPMKRLHPGE